MHSLDELKQIVSLAGLSFSEEELLLLRQELEPVFSFVDSIRMEKQTPSDFPASSPSSLREDIPGIPRKPSEILQNAPSQHNGYFTVEEGKDTMKP